MSGASIHDELTSPPAAFAKEDLVSLVHTATTIHGPAALGTANGPLPGRQTHSVRLVAIGSTIALCLFAAFWKVPEAKAVAHLLQSTNDTVVFAAATIPGEPCAPLGKSCMDAHCCATPGFQCFTKNEIWASCRPWCSRGPDPSDADPGHWRCKPLGPKSPGVTPPPDYTAKAAPWVADKCSAAGDDCSKTKCCKESGTQCFKKTNGWSSCKVDCVAGPDPIDSNNHNWDCSVVGMRTPGPPKLYTVAAKWVADKCSHVGQNCMSSRCCKAAGMQCFQKHETWAMCMDKCKPGPQLSDVNHGHWTCKALGGRTPGMAQAQLAVKTLPPWVKLMCSNPGEDCRKSMCCAQATEQCYRKNEGWAACRRGCNPGHPQADDKAGGNWDCITLGFRTPRPWGTPSLYCFSVIMISTYEADIMRQAISHKGGVGIFGCEQYDVFSSEGNVWLGDGPLGAVRTEHFDPAPVTRSVDGTAGNTALFMNVWEAVKWVGRYALTDWTIKADPDAVIFADRLRGHLAPVGGAAYIVNCNKADMRAPMMFGSLEAISKLGLQNYFNNEGPCKTDYQYGEDRWLGNCLQRIGTRGAQDFSIVGDQVCTKPPGSPCNDNKPAYHPYKSAGAWMACYNQAVQ